MPGDMVDLKRQPKADMKATDSVACCGPKEPYYPISIWLDTEEITKLGLSDCQVGEEMMLELKVKVTGLSINETDKSEKRAHMTLTAMAGQVEAQDEPASEEEKASALYTKG